MRSRAASSSRVPRPGRCRRTDIVRTEACPTAQYACCVLLHYMGLSVLHLVYELKFCTAGCDVTDGVDGVI